MKLHLLVRIEKALKLCNLLIYDRLHKIKAEIKETQRFDLRRDDVVHLSLAHKEQVTLLHGVHRIIYIKCTGAGKHVCNLIDRLLVLKGLVTCFAA